MNFPEHNCSLHLTHNRHRAYYQTVQYYLSDLDDQDISAEDRAACIAADEVWELQWYPDTPAGFYTVYGSTLERVLTLANRVQP